MLLSHPERHRTDRIGWLRAAVLGAHDGIVSTASLVVGQRRQNWAFPRCRILRCHSSCETQFADKLGIRVAQAATQRPAITEELRESAS